MTPDMKSKLRHLLIEHEAYRLMPYTDSVGKVTIGIGRNLTDRGILPTELDMMFDHDTDYFYNYLADKFPWFNKLDEVRQIALVDMCFMGTKRFCGFVNMIAALESGDYEKASQELLDSEYAKEVGKRADDLANILRTGGI